MTRSMALSLMLASLVTGLPGCLDSARSDTNAPPVGVTAQDLGVNQFARIFYYSDETYSTRIGTYISNCGGSRSQQGWISDFTRGLIETCFSPTITYGCFENTLDGTVCPLQYEFCQTC